MLTDGQKLVCKLRAHKPLIAQVVDRENGLDMLKLRANAVLLVQKQGDQPRLPIVQMNHVRNEVKHKHHFERGAAEEAESLRLEIAVAIDVILLEIVFVVDKIPFHAVLLYKLNADVLTAPAEVDIKIRNMRHGGLVFFRNAAVLGYQHAHLRALLL